MPRKNYEKLRTWQLSMVLVEHCYKLTSSFPPEEKSGLTNTIRRNIMTLPTSIAEAHQAPTEAALSKLKAAKASLLELETTLLLCKRMKFITRWSLRRMRRKAQNLSLMLEDEIELLLDDLEEESKKTRKTSKTAKAK